MNNTTKTDIFENYSIPKAFLSLAIPTIISQIIGIIYNYADSWFLGKVDNANAVAAISVAMPIFILMPAIANLFGIGGSSLIARFLGKKEPEKAKHTFAFSLWFSFFSAILFSIIFVVFQKPIVKLIGGTSDTTKYINQYLFITIAIGAIPTIINNVFGHLVRAVGASKEASIGMGLGGIINIILDPIFMFLILPSGYEVVAVALATMISNLISAIYFIIYILKHQKESPVYTLNIKDISFKDKIVQNVLLIGFPAAMGTALAMLSNILANVLSKAYGTYAIAGLGIAKKANTLAFNICMGITQGMLPFIAYNYASKNHKRMKKGIAFMFSIALGFSLVFMALFKIFTPSFIKFFIASQKDTIEYGVMCLDIIAFAIPLCAISFSSNTVFQATGKKINSFILSILRKGLFDMPLMYILRGQIGMKGILWATPIAEILSAIIAISMCLFFFAKLKKEDKKLENINNEEMLTNC